MRLAVKAMAMSCPVSPDCESSRERESRRRGPVRALPEMLTPALGTTAGERAICDVIGRRL
jgi:hypothetical protein